MPADAPTRRPLSFPSLPERRRTAAALAGAIWLAACGGGGGGREEPLAAPTASRWSEVLPLPLVPAAAATLSDGKVLLWAAEDRHFFLTPGVTGQTYTALFDPATGSVSERLVQDTGHDMFCPGTTLLADGRLLVSGGIDAAKTSLYDPATGQWTSGGDMNIPRGYQANTLLPDGSVLTLGGSWSGERGGKNAELWTAAGGWRLLPGVPVAPMLTADKDQPFRGDNHMWLIPTAGGEVLQAGPSVAMNWIDPRGEGSTRPAGPRGDDEDSMNGTLAMYEPGKLLKAGGSRWYDGVYANASAYRIDVSGAAGSVAVAKLAPMTYQRVFHNGVVLPNGQVLIVGGQTYAAPMSDDNSILAPELWDPATGRFTVLPPQREPRNYHSIALLLPDARVLSAGGGLCGPCTANHPSMEILTPYYLLNPDGTSAPRPRILSAPAEAAYGGEVEVTTDGSIESLVLVRTSSTTHTVNNDQRRVPLAVRQVGSGRYAAAMPIDANIALPGAYMLFALNARGVPSVAKLLRLHGDASF